MKYLIIDDHDSIIRSLRRYFEGRDNVVVAECHSVEEALAAITEHNPDVIFLDHCLSGGKGEGLEITDWIRKNRPGIKIYSTTNNDSLPLYRAYAERGIEIIGKDIKKIAAIIG